MLVTRVLVRLSRIQIPNTAGTQRASTQNAIPMSGKLLCARVYAASWRKGYTFCLAFQSNRCMCQGTHEGRMSLEQRQNGTGSSTEGLAMRRPCRVGLRCSKPRYTVIGSPPGPRFRLDSERSLALTGEAGQPIGAREKANTNADGCLPALILRTSELQRSGLRARRCMTQLHCIPDCSMQPTDTALINWPLHTVEVM